MSSGCFISVLAYLAHITCRHVMGTLCTYCNGQHIHVAVTAATYVKDMTCADMYTHIRDKNNLCISIHHVSGGI